VSLRYVSAVAWFGLFTLSAALCYALAAGHFYTDGSALLENPWGFATVVDVYVGFALFSCWVAWREPSLARALVWIVLIMVGGNLVSAIYVLIALRSSKRNIETFWYGPEHDYTRLEPRLQRIQPKDQ
jgi:hypothetical protein